MTEDIEQQKHNSGKKSRIIRFLNIILFAAIIITAVLLFVIAACRLKTVKVSGNTLYTSDQIESMVITGKYKNNTVYEFLTNTFLPKKDIEFVSDVSVKMTGLNSLSISIKEKSTAAYIKDKEGGYIYINRKGKVTEISNTLIDDSIPVEGFDISEGDAVIGEDLPVNGNRVSALSLILTSSKSRDIKVSRITFDEDGTIKLKSHKINVMLGTRKKLEEKMRRLASILPMLKKKKGTLHLENFSDDNTDVVFKED